MGRVWPDKIVVEPPALDDGTGLRQVGEDLLVRTLIAQPLKLSTNPFCCGLPGAM